MYKLTELTRTLVMLVKVWWLPGLRDWLEIKWVTLFCVLGQHTFNYSMPLSMPLSTQVLMLAHTRGLVPVTSPCNKLRRHISIVWTGHFASKSYGRDQLWSLRLVPWIQTSLNFWDKSLRLVPQNCFMWTVCGTSCCNQSLWVPVNSSGDWL